MKHDLELSDRRIDEAVAELSEEFAREVGAFADLFERWRRPEVARAVVESLLDNDRDKFNELLRPEIDDPRVRDLYFCYKLLLLLDKLGELKIERTQEVCRLRIDLSPEERRRYLAIMVQCGEAIFEDDGIRDRLGIRVEGPVISPGPCLDALKAEGLVKCEQDTTVRYIDTRFGVFSGIRDMCELAL